MVSSSVRADRRVRVRPCVQDITVVENIGVIVEK